MTTRCKVNSGHQHCRWCCLSWDRVPHQCHHCVCFSSGAEGFSKRKLFEIMDGLERETRPLMEVHSFALPRILRPDNAFDTQNLQCKPDTHSMSKVLLGLRCGKL